MSSAFSIDLTPINMANNFSILLAGNNGPAIGSYTRLWSSYTDIHTLPERVEHMALRVASHGKPSIAELKQQLELAKAE
jgi:hypothetical protein